jgi:hypothetical protein
MRREEEIDLVRRRVCSAGEIGEKAGHDRENENNQEEEKVK